jgi:hypothetical protein
MDNVKLVRRILKMDSWELLEHVLFFPEHLTDSYYQDFERAIRLRHKELKEIRSA